VADRLEQHDVTMQRRDGGRHVDPSVVGRRQQQRHDDDASLAVEVGDRVGEVSRVVVEERHGDR